MQITHTNVGYNRFLQSVYIRYNPDFRISYLFVLILSDFTCDFIWYLAHYKSSVKEVREIKVASVVSASSSIQKLCLHDG